MNLEKYHNSAKKADTFIIRGNFEAGSFYINTAKSGKTYGKGRFSYDTGSQWPNRISVACFSEELARDIKRNEGVQMTLELEYREKRKQDEAGKWNSDITIAIKNAFIPFPKDKRPANNDDLFNDLPWDTDGNKPVGDPNGTKDGGISW